MAGRIYGILTALVGGFLMLCHCGRVEKKYGEGEQREVRDRTAVL